MRLKLGRVLEGEEIVWVFCHDWVVVVGGGGGDGGVVLAVM